MSDTFNSAEMELSENDAARVTDNLIGFSFFGTFFLDGKVERKQASCKEAHEATLSSGFTSTPFEGRSD